MARTKSKQATAKVLAKRKYPQLRLAPYPPNAQAVAEAKAKSKEEKKKANLDFGDGSNYQPLLQHKSPAKPAQPVPVEMNEASQPSISMDDVLRQAAVPPSQAFANDDDKKEADKIMNQVAVPLPPVPNTPQRWTTKKNEVSDSVIEQDAISMFPSPPDNDTDRVLETPPSQQGAVPMDTASESKSAKKEKAPLQPRMLLMPPRLRDLPEKEATQVSMQMEEPSSTPDAAPSSSMHTNSSNANQAPAKTFTESVSEDFAKMRDGMKAVQKILKEKSETMNSLTYRLNSSIDKQEETEEQLSVARREAEELQKRVRELDEWKQSLLSHMKLDMEGQQDVIKSLEQAVEQYQKELQDEKDKANDANRALSLAKSEAADNAERLAKMVDDAKGLARMIRNLDSERAEQEIDIRALNNEIQQLKDQLEEAQDELESKEADIEEYAHSLRQNREDSEIGRKFGVRIFHDANSRRRNIGTWLILLPRDEKSDSERKFEIADVEEVVEYGRKIRVNYYDVVSDAKGVALKPMEKKGKKAASVCINPIKSLLGDMQQFPTNRAELKRFTDFVNNSIDGPDAMRE